MVIISCHYGNHIHQWTVVRATSPKSPFIVLVAMAPPIRLKLLILVISLVTIATGDSSIRELPGGVLLPPEIKSPHYHTPQTPHQTTPPPPTTLPVALKRIEILSARSGFDLAKLPRKLQLRIVRKLAKRLPVSMETVIRSALANDLQRVVDLLPEPSREASSFAEEVFSAEENGGFHGAASNFFEKIEPPNTRFHGNNNNSNNHNYNDNPVAMETNAKITKIVQVKNLHDGPNGTTHLFEVEREGQGGGSGGGPGGVTEEEELTSMEISRLVQELEQRGGGHRRKQASPWRPAELDFPDHPDHSSGGGGGGQMDSGRSLLEEKLKKMELELERLKKKEKPNTSKTPQQPPKCEFFSTELCLETEDYPGPTLTTALETNPTLTTQLLVSTSDSLATNSTLETKLKQEGGFLCPSKVAYATPKKGRSATSKKWKFIINLGGEHVQRLRMEKCLSPGGKCSYTLPQYKTSCTQVYAYHRLLAWDHQRGLHYDLFKIPSVCTCHVSGFYFAPPKSPPPPTPRSKLPPVPAASRRWSRPQQQPHPPMMMMGPGGAPMGGYNMHHGHGHHQMMGPGGVTNSQINGEKDEEQKLKEREKLDELLSELSAVRKAVAELGERRRRRRRKRTHTNRNSRMLMKQDSDHTPPLKKKSNPKKIKKIPLTSLLTSSNPKKRQLGRKLARLLLLSNKNHQKHAKSHQEAAAEKPQKPMHFN